MLPGSLVYGTVASLHTSLARIRIELTNTREIHSLNGCYSSADEFLPHVPDRVFVHSTIARLLTFRDYARTFYIGVVIPRRTQTKGESGEERVLCVSYARIFRIGRIGRPNGRIKRPNGRSKHPNGSTECMNVQWNQPKERLD